MESRTRLPKPSGLPISKTLASINRAKLNTGVNLRLGLERLPLSRDLVNHLNGNRAKSPDIQLQSSKSDPLNRHKIKLRRSKSASDLRENVQTSKFVPTLPSIPARFPNVRTTRPQLTRHVSQTATTTRSTTAVKPTTVKPSASSAAAIAAAKTRRIPPYDYKARFNDLLERHKVLKERAEEQKEKIEHFETLSEQYNESQEKISKLTADNQNYQSQVLECQRESASLESKLLICDNKIETLIDSLQKTKDKLDNFTAKCQALELERNQLRDSSESTRALNEVLTKENNELIEKLQQCSEQLFSANIERKDLHNTVMDLRGNIRVFCRVRPPLCSERDRSKFGLAYLDECSLEIAHTEPGTGKLLRYDFSFDQVFHERAGQDDIFGMVSPLIQSALDGYNVCIFAYGQTGSGKTYTMEGVENNLGIIPRTVDLLFESVRSYKRFGWEYKIRATFLEIYNETLYDLLSPENRDLEIRMASATNKAEIYVSNLTEEDVVDEIHLHELMDLARSNRATAATVGNERSSRSHAVTKIELTGFHAEKGERAIGTINLVDLAGSESPKTSIRMDETKNINRSLSELSNVVLALVQKNEHIPYRNSKLTHLLMPSLGGNSKTLMFINISPFQDCFTESVKSLRFAGAVNSCKLNKAKKNKTLNSSAV